MTNMFHSPPPNDDPDGLDALRRYEGYYSRLADRILEELNPMSADNRQTRLMLRTDFRVICLNPYSDYTLEPVRPWAERHHVDLAAHPHCVAVLIAHAGVQGLREDSSIVSSRALVFFHNWDAGQEALDKLLTTQRGVLDFRALARKGAPQFNPEHNKEARTIDLNHQHNHTQVSEASIPSEEMQPIIDGDSVNQHMPEPVHVLNPGSGLLPPYAHRLEVVENSGGRRQIRLGEAVINTDRNGHFHVVGGPGDVYTFFPMDSGRRLAYVRRAASSGRVTVAGRRHMDDTQLRAAQQYSQRHQAARRARNNE